MHYIISVPFAVILIHYITTGAAVIVTHPKTSETPIGELAYFNCSTTKTTEEIQWFHYPEPNSERKLVYGFDQFHNVYRGFRMERVDSSGSWNLVIPSVAIENAGKYECQDDIGRGEKSSANLTVLGSTEFNWRIEMKSVIGSNNCGIEPSQLMLSCSVGYKGSEAPVFEWKKTGEDKPMSDEITTRETLPNNRIRYNLTLNGDAIKNGSSYACYATRSTSSKHYCDSGNIMVVGNVVDTEVNIFEACQIHMGAIVLFVITCLCNALAAGVVWYLLVYYQINNNEGFKFQCKFSKEIIIFIILMAIPFCIGLLLWYLFVYRRAQLKNEKGNRERICQFNGTIENAGKYECQDDIGLKDKISSNLIVLGQRESGDLAAFLNQPRKIKALEERIETLAEEKETLFNKTNQMKELEERIESLRRENENLIEQIEQHHKAENENRLREEQLAPIRIKKVRESKQIDLNEFKGKRNMSSETSITSKETDEEKLQEKVETLEAKLNATERRLYSSENVKYPEKPKPVYIIETDVSKEGQWINGLAVLGIELFIVHWNCSEIDVYDSVTYQLQRKLQIPIIAQPFDLTAGKSDRCLFIIGLARQPEIRAIANEDPSNVILEGTSEVMDENLDRFEKKENAGACVKNQESGQTKHKEPGRSDGKKKDDKSKLKDAGKIADAKTEETESVIVKFDINGALYDPWPKPSGGGRGQLSTYESNLVVCIHKKTIIKEFSRDGDLIRLVRLSPAAGITHPWHAIKVTSMHYVVSHGKKEDALNRICVIDIDGNIVMECRDPKFEAPIHFIEDDKRSILAADFLNNRILLLNWDLKFLRTLIKVDNKDLPGRLCFDEARNTLFVAVFKRRNPKGYKDARVLIFDLK